MARYKWWKQKNKNKPQTWTISGGGQVVNFEGGTTGTITVSNPGSTGDYIYIDPNTVTFTEPSVVTTPAHVIGQSEPYTFVGGNTVVPIEIGNAVVNEEALREAMDRIESQGLRPNTILMNPRDYSALTDSQSNFSMGCSVGNSGASYRGCEIQADPNMEFHSVGIVENPVDPTTRFYRNGIEMTRVNESSEGR